MHKIKNLVLSGGGLQGISFLGVLKYLSENNLLNEIENYVGTSVGSLICFLLLIGYTYEELFNFCISFNMEKLVKDPNLDNFLEFYGFESSNKLTYVIKRLMDNKNLSKDITFLEFFNLNKKKLTITGVCVNNKKLNLFNYENTPDMKILIAVTISCNIPILFSPIKYENKLWIDGGAILNYPIEISDDLDNTLGIAIFDKQDLIEEDMEDILSYLSNLVKSMIYGSNNLTVEKYIFNTIRIDRNINFMTGFSIDKESMNNLFTNGYKIASEQSYKLNKFIYSASIINVKKFIDIKSIDSYEDSDEYESDEEYIKFN